MKVGFGQGTTPERLKAEPRQKKVETAAPNKSAARVDKPSSSSLADDVRRSEELEDPRFLELKKQVQSGEYQVASGDAIAGQILEEIQAYYGIGDQPLDGAD